jgi:hypothetical protein
VSNRTIVLSGYAEAYYSYDLSQPVNHLRPSFFYSFNRHNEVNLNIAFAKATYAEDRTRANLAIMAGTYPQYNLAHELPLLKNIFEANAGVKLFRKHNIWVDAGIMPSHIGFESAVGKDCPNLTRSILADNSPYYETGVKLGYTNRNEKLYCALMYLQGWQRIQKVPGNKTPALGTQITFKPKDYLTFNWSTYIGTEFPDTVRRWRYFNNFYGLFTIKENLAITTGFDIGLQQRFKNSSEYDWWYSPVLIARYNISEKIKVAARTEYYHDAKGVIISTGTTNGFKTLGYSLNFDFLPIDRIMVRVEGRTLNSRDKIFTLNKKPASQNHFVTASVAVSF